MDQLNISQPHVLFFPLPAQGDLTPMLNLAELLCLHNNNIKITFLNTTHIHQRITRFTDIQTRFDKYPYFRFETVADGLPVDHPRAGGNWLFELLNGLKLIATPFLKEILSGSDRANRVSCLIVDWALRFAFDLAKEAQVPVIKFTGGCASFLLAYLSTPKMFELGELPVKDEEDMDKLVENVAGMSSFLRKRDLPSFCYSPSEESINSITKSSQKEAYPIILNTFEDLEGPFLSHLKPHFPRIYSIGPIHAHLKQTLCSKEISVSKSTSCSIWEEDHTCISWLDQKPDKSVIFVSFGSLTYLTRDQYLVIWVGLVRSNKYFLWVVRPNMVSGDGEEGSVPDEVLEGTKERGCMVCWAPQEEVLGHRAVGGFLTHCGWNSTIESIVAGVPMLCWPHFYDQMGNRRFVCEVWKIGLDMEGTCDRNVVEKKINDLMDWRNDELKRSAAKMSYLAKKSISEGGSSYRRLNDLIEDIKAMSNNVVQLCSMKG